MSTLATVQPGKTKIGFIGTGIMGQSMAGHLQKAGYSLYVYNRTKAKAEKLLSQGAIWCDNPGAVARHSNVAFSMVGYPADVHAIYLGADGIIANAKPATIVCDMTTSKPSLAQEIFQAGKDKGIFSLDAPVSGGDIGAREARLAIMVGGPEEAFNCVLPLFQLMGQNIVLMGPAGAGQHTKMCNQIAIAGTMMGMIESLRYAKASGLSQEKLLAAIGGGAAGSWSLSNLAPRIIANNFGPGFLLKHFVKDMAIAQQEADQMYVNTPILDKTLEIYRRAENAGGGNLGTHGLYQVWDEHPDW